MGSVLPVSHGTAALGQGALGSGPQAVHSPVSASESEESSSDDAEQPVQDTRTTEEEVVQGPAQGPENTAEPISIKSHAVPEDEPLPSKPMQNGQAEGQFSGSWGSSDGTMTYEQPGSPVSSRIVDHAHGRGRGRGQTRTKRVPPRQLQPLNVLDQEPQHAPPRVFQQYPGRPPYGSPTMLKATCSPLSQKSSIASSPHHDELFDTMSPHSTAGSMSPGYVHGHIYGRPPSSSGSMNRGPMLRTPSRSQGPHPNMPFQQHSPAQSIVGYPSSFIHLNDHRHAIEPISPPPTGYSLLASKLAARFPDGQGLPIQPLYRRFGKLTHRMLLHLQDEICQLEDQLHGVDDAGAHNRQMYPGHISPESRRAEESANGELYQHKTHLLGQIGFKLELYNNLLKSFHTTQDMPSASVDDVHDYRTFLNDETPIDELETRFLDHVDDLLCFPVGDYGVRNDEDVSATPVQGKSPPQFYTINRAPPGKMSSGQGSSSSGGRVDEPGSSANELVAALGAVSVSILVPVLAFLIVPGFIGRLVVSLLVGVGVVMALVNSQYTALPQARQAMMLVACYGTVMAILAGVVA